MTPPAIVRENPNATTAAVATGPSALIVWLLGNVAHVSIPAEVAVLIGAAVTTTWLAFAQVGALGLWSRLLHGSPKK